MAKINTATLNALNLAAQLDSLGNAPKAPVVFANGFRTNDTKNAAIVRRSSPVFVVSVIWDEADRSIRVLCDDKKVRTCRVDRFEDINEGRALYQQMTKLVGKKTPVRFKAAGNFSPDTWFSAVEVYEAKKVAGVPF